MTNDQQSCLGFSHCLGIGPLRYQALIKKFGTADRAFWARSNQLANVIGTKTTEKLIAFRNSFDLNQKLRELTGKKITVLSIQDKAYPDQLKNIPDPPICLYIRGDLGRFNLNNFKKFFLAVVGTRHPTPYGQTVAKRFVKELAGAGMVIVSGMAIGIDSIAHRETLASGSWTVAILGCGVDIIYPAENARLYRQIVEKGGLVISEFPPGQTVVKGLFIARNRIISGLSRGVLVIEGASDSGALITARYAGQQGKEVFAPPGPLTSAMSAAPNFLLKQGAKLVTSVEDIFEEFNLKVRKIPKVDVIKTLTEDEKVIFEILAQQPASIDDLVLILKKSAGEILAGLSMLEIKGLVDKDSQGRFQIKI